jgi:hypothetical protein
MQGGVIAAVGMGEFLAAVEQEYFFHGSESKGLEMSAGRLSTFNPRNKQRCGKIHLIKTHE